MSGSGGSRAFVIGTAAAVAGLAAAAWYWGRSRGKAGGSVEADEAKILTLPVIDFRSFDNRVNDKDAYMAECKKVADALHKYGLCVVRDPRVQESENNIFVEMMERYFELSDGIRDARPEYAFQVGVTPEFTGASAVCC